MIPDLIQTGMALLGTMGFAIMFNIKRSKLAVVSVGGAVTWALFLLVQNGGKSEIGGLFVATAFASLLSEVLARMLKTPVVILLVPMLIPLLPGGNLYYTMNYFVRGNGEEFGKYARLVLQEAGSIALGIVVVTSVMQLVFRFGRIKRPFIELK